MADLVTLAEYKEAEGRNPDHSHFAEIDRFVITILTSIIENYCVFLVV